MNGTLHAKHRAGRTLFRVPFAGLLAALACAVSPAQSAYPVRPDDAHAVYLIRPEFGVQGDGETDDSDALQHAVDRVQETTHHGVVFVPAGRYRLTRTIHVWAGIRLIGYGARRPVFVLAPNSSGFQEGADRYMLWFTDERTPEGQPIADASEFTFFSAVSNIDFEIGEGNPAAVAIRFNVAQHSFVSHADFRITSAHAAIEQVGNQASDIHIHGGQYGIVTGKTSPAWQFLLVDSSFDRQQIAAIQTHEAGFTLVRDRFADVPVALSIPDGEIEQLYGQDLEMKNVSAAVLRLGDVKNLRNEITLENIACDQVRSFVLGAPGDDLPRAASSFVEDRFTLGLEIGPDGREQGIVLRHHERPMDRSAVAVPSDIPALPPMRSWFNVRQIGAKGDGGTDDTAVLQQAIDAHQALFFPSGFYRLTSSLRLHANTALIGFSPFTTQLILSDNDPHFQGDGPANPLLIAPRGGTNIVFGIGFATGNANPRAAGVEWLAGEKSMLDDVDFWRGHSEFVRALEPAAPLPLPRSQQPPMQLDAQHPSLWVHDGGGGILRGIWSHGGTAKAGLLIENTTTPGAIYQFSCEHHMRDEVRIDHVANWKIYDLQTEEENPEGADAVAVELDSVHNVLFANTYMYRVSRNVTPKLYAVVAHDSSGVDFDNVKVFSQTRLAFDNSIFDQGSAVEVRAHHFVHFALASSVRLGTPLPLPAAFAPGATLERVATGFSNASGLAADAAGTVYFTDAAKHAIYRYDPEKKQAEILAHTDQSPMTLGFVSPSTLLAVNNEKSVSTVQIDTGIVSQITGTDAPKPGTVLLLPVGLHNEFIQLAQLLEHKGYTYRIGSNTAIRSALLPQPRSYYYAPDSNVAILAGGTWRPLLQSSQLAPFAVGNSHYIVSEEDARTWTGQLGPGETLTTRLSAERGGTSVVSDSAGNVYIAGDQVYVYDRGGHPAGSLEIPERPSSLAFGGKDLRTLFIGARGSLYAIELNAAMK
ncbi:MAG: glycosyl hydrolase family 28-related protein [Acidobacteriaceae bacterium]